MTNLSGVNPPVITIFDENGKLDWEANKKQADFLMEKGVDGLSYLGTSGEFSALALEERKQFIREMTAYVNHRVHVIVGVGDTCFANVKELMATAEEAGVDGVLLVNPYFSVYAEEMVEAYYDAAAAVTSLPIIIYNFPDLTGFDFHTELVRRLALKHENIVGIKETVADPEHIRNMLTIKESKPGFLVFAAYENHAMTVLPLGINGFINATVNFAPEFTVNTWRSFQRGDMAAAVENSRKMTEAMEIYRYSSPLFLACKEAAYQRIVGGTHAERLPALPLSSQTKAAIGEQLSKLGLK
ncbi:MAG: dihydrodipicolinate synthase family protein [Intestinimonas sp.]|nr:dihydrodipicolinate synthase family protein [Intestinimonas sp.]